MNTVRLKSELRQRVKRVAEKKGISVSDAHREALERYCADELKEPDQSRYDDVIGVFVGPPDLAANSGRIYGEAMAAKHARRPH